MGFTRRRACTDTDRARDEARGGRGPAGPVFRRKKAMIMAALISMLLLQDPDSIIQKIGIDPHPGAPVDLNLTFRDESGAPVKLAQFFGSKPVILTPVYYECPMLCSMQLNGLVRAMKVMTFSAGKEFEVVTFSLI